MKDRLSLWLGAVCLLWMSQVQAERINFQCDDSKEDAAKLNAAIHASHSGDQLQIHGTCILNETVILRGDRS